MQRPRRGSAKATHQLQGVAVGEEGVDGGLVSAVVAEVVLGPICERAVAVQE